MDDKEAKQVRRRLLEQAVQELDEISGICTMAKRRLMEVLSIHDEAERNNVTDKQKRAFFVYLEQLEGLVTDANSAGTRAFAQLRMAGDWTEILGDLMTDPTQDSDDEENDRLQVEQN